MTVATTDGRAKLLLDEPLEIDVKSVGSYEYPCEIWKDAQGRFVAIVTDDPKRIPSVNTYRLHITAALDVACDGYCDIIIEHWPDASSAKGRFRMDLERGPKRSVGDVLSEGGIVLSDPS